MIERVSRLFAKGYAAKRGNADRARGCRKAEVAVGVDGEHSDKRFGANAVNHREPLSIMGHGDIRRRAWKWDGFVEHAALAIQQGALEGNEGVGPAIGKMFRSSSMMAKLSGLCAGVNPKLFPQKAAP